VTFAGFGTTRGGPLVLWRPAEAPVAIVAPAEITVAGERLVFVVED
jgi:hypothetical protein